MKPQEVVPGVHRLGSPSLVNWYLVEDEGRLTAVDAGLRGFEKTLDDDLGSLGRTRADVAAVVLAHSDTDHTGVAPALRAAGARVLIHGDDAATLAKPAAKSGDAAPKHLLRYSSGPGSGASSAGSCASAAPGSSVCGRPADAVAPARATGRSA